LIRSCPACSDMIYLLVLLILAVKVVLIRRFFSSLFAPNPGIDYAFGKESIIAAGKNFKKGRTELAIGMLKEMPSTDLPYALDHIAQISNEKAILNILNTDSDKPAVSLIAGVWYLHHAWKYRGFDIVENLSSKKIQKFSDWNSMAEAHLMEAAKGSWTAVEANVRLIRCLMSEYGGGERARTSFSLLEKKGVLHIYAYLNYAELIQPKWGGSVDEVRRFAAHLPKDKMIASAVRLKLLLDGIQSSVNYLDDTEVKVTESQIIKEITEAEKVLEYVNPQDIDRYVIYGYIYLLTGYLGDKLKHKKYRKLISENYTIYPFGIMK